MDNLKQELAQAALNGIREYLRSTRGARAVGAMADTELVGNDVIRIVHKNGVVLMQLTNIE